MDGRSPHPERMAQLWTLPTLQESTGDGDTYVFQCRYLLRVWNELKDWLGLTNFDTNLWANYDSLEEWWCHISGVNGRRRKGLSSLLLLTAGEIWNERNARVFRSVASMPTRVVSIIKSNVILWGLAGAKNLSALIPRE
jgi:hypothetical protein